MKNIIPVHATMKGSLLAGRGLNPRIPISTLWGFEHIRAGKLIDKWECLNVITTEGFNHMLDVQFGAVAKIATWYLTIFEDDYTPLITNTYAVPGYTESTAYDEANRIEFIDVPAAARVMTNTASKGTFTISATKIMYGASLVGGTNAATKDDTTAGVANILFCSSSFGGGKSFVDDDVLLVDCTITLADS